MSTFSTALRQYAAEAQQRIELLRQHAEEIGGSPDIVPQVWYSISHPAHWLDELERRYWNMAEFEGWPPLPGYIPQARAWLKAE